MRGWKPPPGPCRRPKPASRRRPTVTLLGEMFPVDPVTIGRMLEPMGLAAGPVVPTREWRELYAALDCAAVAAIHPFYTASIREFQAAGRDVVGSAPVGVEGTAAWLDAIGEACGIPVRTVDAAKAPILAATRAALAGSPINARITLSGYEGSELIVGRLLKESGADLRYVGTACPKTPWNEARRRVAAARMACMSSSAPRWRRTCRPSTASSPISPSARRRWSSTPSRRASRRSTSPT